MTMCFERFDVCTFGFFRRIQELVANYLVVIHLHCFHFSKSFQQICFQCPQKCSVMIVNYVS
jgi:hypothetical protein